MFETLTDRLNTTFARMTNRGRLTEADVDEAMREVRRALLEADVNFKVVRDFVAAVRERAVGEETLKSLTPAQTVISIVHDELIKILGEERVELRSAEQGPTIIMLVGLQGSGKTTHVGKLAQHLRKQGKNPLLVAADVYRPAAIAQLETLGKQLSIPVYSEGADEKPLKIVQNALRAARDKGQNPIIVDTAGRLQIDDAMTGQEAVNVSQEFNRRLDITGLVLTKMDGDARGGAALSIRSVTGIPIKFIGTGERMDALEPFYPERLASRILGMGDVMSLIERAQEETSEEDRAALEEKMMEGSFDLEDFLNQLQSIKKMGPLTQLLEMIPGIGSALREQNVQVSDDDYKHIEGIIHSMTPAERRNPDLIRHSRRNRIARGAGVEPDEVVQLLKQFRDMQKMMGQLGAMTGAGPKKGKKSMLARMPGGVGQLGQMRDLMKQAQAGGLDMDALGGLPGGLPGANPRDLERLMGGAGQLAPLRGGEPSKKARQLPAQTQAERPARPTPSKRRKKKR
jgi:signal recognition particle subunit SRP54